MNQTSSYNHRQYTERQEREYDLIMDLIFITAKKDISNDYFL